MSWESSGNALNCGFAQPLYILNNYFIMYIKQSNRVGIEAVRATSRGQRKPRNSLPQSNKENNVISNWPLLSALGSHCELAKHVGFTSQLAATKNQRWGEVEMLKQPQTAWLEPPSLRLRTAHGESAAGSR